MTTKQTDTGSRARPVPNAPDGAGTLFHRGCFDGAAGVGVLLRFPGARGFAEPYLEPRECFESARRADWVFDPDAPSAASLLLRDLEEREGHEDPPSGELARWASITDSAACETPEQAVFAAEPALTLAVCLSGATAEVNVELALALSRQAIEVVADRPDVRDPYAGYRRREETVRAVRLADGEYDGFVFCFDVRPRKALLSRHGSSRRSLRIRGQPIPAKSARPKAHDPTGSHAPGRGHWTGRISALGAARTLGKIHTPEEWDELLAGLFSDLSPSNPRPDWFRTISPSRIPKCASGGRTPRAESRHGSLGWRGSGDPARGRSARLPAARLPLPVVSPRCLPGERKETSMLGILSSERTIDGLNPHIWFFRNRFGELEIARAFFRCYLPPYCGPELALDTLEVLETNPLEGDEALASMVFRTGLAKQPGGHALLLLRIAGMPHPGVLVRLLGSMVALGEGAQTGDEPAPVIPVVLYHGPKPWNLPLDFRALFGEVPPALAVYLPDFRYILVNVSSSGGALVQ